MRENRRQKRELKDPEERKKEILSMAMELFTHRGYEQTSMRDIARELNISLGLCYRYFDSKNVLFEEAMNEYVKECCQKFILTLQNENISLESKLDIMLSMMKEEKELSRYHEFFHKPENISLHEELSFRICKYIYPYIIEMIEDYSLKYNVKFRNVDNLVSFLTFGQIGLVSQYQMPNNQILENIKSYITILLESQIIPDN